MAEKSKIIFLEVPDSFKEKIKHFEVDRSILLPAEINTDKAEFDPADLSWEMILSGMLRVIKDGDIPEEAGISKDTSEWIDYYREFVLSVKPEIYHEFTSAAIVKAGNGEYDMALEINGYLEGLFPRSPGVLLNKALILEEKAGTLEKNGHAAEEENALALEAYETALITEPVLPDTFFNAGFFFMRLRDFERAKECFSRYIELEQDSEIQEISSGINKEKTEQAKKIIRDISGQGLDDASFREGYDLVNRGRDQEGLVKIREFIEKHPKVRNGWFVLGWALRKLGRFEDALESFRKAVELGGTDIDTQNEIAICLMELGDFKTARKELEKALRLEPENIKIISNLGVVALKMGNKNESEAFFRTVLELDPDDPLARHYLSPEP